MADREEVKNIESEINSLINKSTDMKDIFHDYLWKRKSKPFERTLQVLDIYDFLIYFNLFKSNKWKI